MSSNDAVTTSAERLTGRVKWFNNKAGYGFVTVTDGSRSGTDVFVHHSAVQVENQQYKYLVQGEYVEFSLSDTPSGRHEFQAANVSGIKAGKLMCETRREFKIARTNYRSSSSVDGLETNETSAEVSMPRQKTVRAPRLRGEGPRESGITQMKLENETTDKKEWTLVRGSATGRGRGRPPRSTQETK
jgi:cold shock CspA family protein